MKKILGSLLIVCLIAMVCQWIVLAKEDERVQRQRQNELWLNDEGDWTNIPMPNMDEPVGDKKNWSALPASIDHSIMSSDSELRIPESESITFTINGEEMCVITADDLRSMNSIEIRDFSTVVFLFSSMGVVWSEDMGLAILETFVPERFFKNAKEDTRIDLSKRTNEESALSKPIFTWLYGGEYLTLDVSVRFSLDQETWITLPAGARIYFEEVKEEKGEIKSKGGE